MIEENIEESAQRISLGPAFVYRLGLLIIEPTMLGTVDRMGLMEKLASMAKALQGLYQDWPEQDKIGLEHAMVNEVEFHFNASEFQGLIDSKPHGYTVFDFFIKIWRDLYEKNQPIRDLYDRLNCLKYDMSIYSTSPKRGNWSTVNLLRDLHMLLLEAKHHYDSMEDKMAKADLGKYYSSILVKNLKPDLKISEGKDPNSHDLNSLHTFWSHTVQTELLVFGREMFLIFRTSLQLRKLKMVKLHLQDLSRIVVRRVLPRETLGEPKEMKALMDTCLEHVPGLKSQYDSFTSFNADVMAKLEYETETIRVSSESPSAVCDDFQAVMDRLSVTHTKEESLKDQLMACFDELVKMVYDDDFHLDKEQLE